MSPCSRFFRWLSQSSVDRRYGYRPVQLWGRVTVKLSPTWFLSYQHHTSANYIQEVIGRLDKSSRPGWPCIVYTNAPLDTTQFPKAFQIWKQLDNISISRTKTARDIWRVILASTIQIGQVNCCSANQNFSSYTYRNYSLRALLRSGQRIPRTILSFFEVLKWWCGFRLAVVEACQCVRLRGEVLNRL